MKRKIDGMLIAAFLTTIFYSATHPYIHKQMMLYVSDSAIALNQIITCLSAIALGALWNKKSEKLFKYYPILCIAEIILGVLSTLWVTTTNSVAAYYIVNAFIFAVITRNIYCGNIKIKAIRYNTKVRREHFDNNYNSISAIATIIGSVIAMLLNLNFKVMLWLATFGTLIDNVFYLIIFNSMKSNHDSYDFCCSECSEKE